jgi:hypothetical protein
VKSGRMIRLAAVTLLFTVALQLSAQEITDRSLINEEIFRFRVKQFTEFVDRFNNTFNAGEVMASGNEMIILSREAAVSSLFNQEDPRLDRQSEQYDPAYEKAARAFITQVSADSLFIRKNSENIFAIARTEGLFRGKKVQFDIILQQEQVGRDMLKWVINDVDASFLEFFLEDTLNLRFLPPSSDELDFMELRRALNDKQYLYQYADRHYRYDPLSVFFYLLNIDQLTIETVTDVRYLVRDIPNWEIEVTDYNRPTKNSGWLISNIKHSENNQ